MLQSYIYYYKLKWTIYNMQSLKLTLSLINILSYLFW